MVSHYPYLLGLTDAHGLSVGTPSGDRGDRGDRSDGADDGANADDRAMLDEQNRAWCELGRCGPRGCVSGGKPE